MATQQSKDPAQPASTPASQQAASGFQRNDLAVATFDNSKELLLMTILAAGVRSALGLNASPETVAREAYFLRKAVDKVMADPPKVPKL